MENWQWVIDTFTAIGIIVSIIAAFIAIVWVTFYVVKILIKTFGVKVGKSCDLIIEDINKKAESKKERNEKKRAQKSEHKMELLNMKLESKARVHEMKKQKLANSLELKESVQKIKILGEEEVKLNEIKTQITGELDEENPTQEKPKIKNLKSIKETTEE